MVQVITLIMFALAQKPNIWLIKVDGTSFCTPHIVNKLAEGIEKFGKDKEKLIMYMKENSLSVIVMEQDEKEEIENHIENVIIFPYNKEMYNIIKFADKIRITGIYDIKGRGKIGKNIEINDDKIIYIQDWENINWKADFDTVILGHIRIIENVCKKRIAEKILENAKKNNKRVYMFDMLLENELVWREIILTPYEIGKVNYNKNFGKLYRVKTPVLGVVGTSSMQGKFNLQLQIKRKFEDNNYTVGHIGTEPSSYFVGADEIFPYGFNSGIHLSPLQIIYHINYLIHKIEQKKRDIILFGCQSNLVHSCYGNVRFYPAHQYEILAGSDPDLIIMCFNYGDNLDYIQKNINYITVVTRAEIIGLVLYPFKKQFMYNEVNMVPKEKCTFEEIREKKRKICEETGYPVYCLTDDEDIDKLHREIVRFFSR